MDFQRILFPLDFSERSVAVAKYVADMAGLFHSSLTLVHAVEDPLHWYGSPNPVETVEVDLPKAVRGAQEQLKRFAAEHFPSLDAATVSECASPLELIEKTAKDVHADMIMMATRGCGRFRAALLGSVTTKVLHDLTLPLWTDSHQETSTHHWPVKKLLCAIDLGPDSLRVLRLAADFAGRCGAEMFIAHGVPVADMALGPYARVEPPEYMEDFARGDIEKLQQEAGTVADVYLESGPIAIAVRNGALQHMADLVVMGRSHHAISVSGHAYSILRTSPCPVLSFQIA